MNENLLNKVPSIGDFYIDYRGRELYIENIEKDNILDRHVQGRININYKNYSYSCSLQIWVDIWRDKAPPLDPIEMKIG